MMLFLLPRCGVDGRGTAKDAANIVESERETDRETDRERERERRALDT